MTRCNAPSRSIRACRTPISAWVCTTTTRPSPPRAARVLRVLLLLPAGDRAGGLREMQQTQNRGLLLRGEADYQLHLIYLWYEHQPMTALRLIEGLRARYPHNPLFALRAAGIQNDAFHNAQASLQIYRSLLDAARAGRVASPAIAEVNARLGMAQEMDLLCDTVARDRAVEARHRCRNQPRRTPQSRARITNLVPRSIVPAIDPMRSPRISSALASIPSDDRLQLAPKVREGLKQPAIGRICR